MEGLQEIDGRASIIHPCPSFAFSTCRLFYLRPAWRWLRADVTVLVNGKILTVDPRFSTAEALVVRDGRIVAVGSSDDLRKMAGKQARVIDLAGRTVIPGLDRFAHARHPRGAQLQHRGQLDRRAIARGSAGSNPPGLAQHDAGRVADRRGRLERRSNSRRIAGPRRPNWWRPRRTIRCTFSWATAGRS